MSSAAYQASLKANVGRRRLPIFSFASSPQVDNVRQMYGNGSTVCICPRHESEYNNVSTSDLTRQHQIMLLINTNKNKYPINKYIQT